MILAHSAEPQRAQNILHKTESFARRTIRDNNLDVALRHVANAFAENEQLAQALTILDDVSEKSNRTPVLITAATKQALAGDAAAALATAGIGKLPDAQARSLEIFIKTVQSAEEIDDNRLRAHTLWTIAAEQIRAGDDHGAQGTKAKANQATGKMKGTLSRV